MRPVIFTVFILTGLAVSRIIPRPAGNCSCTELKGSGFKYSLDGCFATFSCQRNGVIFTSRNTTTTIINGITSIRQYEADQVYIVDPGQSLPRLQCVGNTSWNSLGNFSTVTAVKETKCI